jgi:L-amino acid N-acyltransferase YncA
MLCALHAAFEGISFDATAIASRLEKAAAIRRAQILVAERDDELVGYASVTLEFSTLQAAYFAHLDCLFVKEGCPGSGIGSQLFMEVWRSPARKITQPLL